ncbi:tetratricopeptide repeat-containing glycosyltransferase family protein [Rhodopila sp.]|uniref:tetratricopeptide repeat-containing glycosyltransferase family protein n=1 Tax=Rhodopila sp. TaxID=2480087 RepID=UPI002CFFD000|nr:tetratricopeptide repeat-containing glycosyltransferase family protein [Rhodopila sp.]HVZ06523.1 tetratricopeptide repeat-containing glycosyltransferase family protein [Rhodopila sp.]
MIREPVHSEDAVALHTFGFELHRQGRVTEAEAFYRRALHLEPDFVTAWMNLGLAHVELGSYDSAEECEREALRLDPDQPDAHNQLGMIHYKRGRLAEAENCFRSALRLDPAHANATLNLGSVRQVFDHPEEAEGLFRRAIALGVNAAHAHSNLALCLMEQVRPVEAEAMCREALRERPNYPEAKANLALALMMMGRLKEGWDYYETRWEVEGRNRPVPKLDTPRWTGQPLNGETVLLFAEQGFGDTLQFCRYAPMVAARGGRVVLVVPRALRRLLMTLDGVSVLLAEDDDTMPGFDYHCPLLSLPYAFGTELDTIPAAVPYLKADSHAWRPFLGSLPGLKVGLVWAGRSRTDQPHAVALDKRRSMHLFDMAALFDVPGVSFVSLQLGPPARQMRCLPEDVLLHDVSARIADWADTADLIAGLDLVIAVDTAVAHLAGALGKPVWMLNRYDSCWRWFVGREDTPWYPTMRIFRQKARNDWTGVIAEVHATLSAYASRAGAGG